MLLTKVITLVSTIYGLFLAVLIIFRKKEQNKPTYVSFCFDFIE